MIGSGARHGAWSAFVSLLLGLTSCHIGAPSLQAPESAVWTGRWASDKHAFVNGQVSLRLPDPLPPPGRYAVPAKFESALLLISKGQPTTQARLDLQVQDAGPGMTESHPDADLLIHLATRGIFGVERQEVVYEAGFNRGDTVIEGRYHSVGPSDRGWFRVERASAHPSAGQNTVATP